MSSPDAVSRAVKRRAFREWLASGQQLIGWPGHRQVQPWPFVRTVMTDTSRECKLIISGPSGVLASGKVAYPSHGEDFGYAHVVADLENSAVFEYTGWTGEGLDAGATPQWFYTWRRREYGEPPMIMSWHRQIREALADKVIAVHNAIVLFLPKHTGSNIAAVVRHDPVFGVSVDYKHIDEDTIYSCSLEHFATHIVR